MIPPDTITAYNTMMAKAQAYAEGTKAQFVEQARKATSKLTGDEPAVLAGSTIGRESYMVSYASASAKIFQVNDICQQIINIFVEERVFGWCQLNKRSNKYYFDGINKESVVAPFKAIDNMAFVQCYCWITDYTEREEIMVPVSWFDDFKPDTVREYAKAMARGARVAQAAMLEREQAEAKAAEIETMKQLMGKHAFEALDFMKGR